MRTVDGRVCRPLLRAAVALLLRVGLLESRDVIDLGDDETRQVGHDVTLSR